MKPRRLLLLLLLALGPAGQAAAAPAKRGFDAPTGLTLQARDNGRYQLLWDPIYRDDLVGYSIWLRRPGEREFTRLSVPVKVGQEVRKMPLVTEARLVLALGASKGDVEVAVVAEYEDGSSGRTPSAFTARVAKAVPADAAAAAGASAETHKADLPTAADKDAPAPWTRDQTEDVALICPPWTLKVALGGRLEHRSFKERGSAPWLDKSYFYTGDLLFAPSGSSLAWDSTAVGQILTAPVKLTAGLLPRLEASVEASYVAERAYSSSFRVDGRDYTADRLRAKGGDGVEARLEPFQVQGFGDLGLALRAQILADLPLAAALQVSVPTGRSRVRASMNWSSQRPQESGTGLGAYRISFGLDTGTPGRKPGFSAFMVHRLSVLENFVFDGDVYFNSTWIGRIPLKNSVYHGSVSELGGAYTVPWKVLGRNGALSLELIGRSREADRWTVEGQDQAAVQEAPDKAESAAFTGLSFRRDDQLELGLGLRQQMEGRYEAGGRFAYSLNAFGDTVSAGLFLSY